MSVSYAQGTFSDAKNMGVAKAGDDVYIVFQATDSKTKKQDIYLSSSHDGGKTYKTINLSNGKIFIKSSGAIPENKTVESSFNPQIAIDKEGDVYVAWNAKGAGNPNYVVLATSKDKFETPVTPVVNMTKIDAPGTEPKLVNDEVSGGVSLYYITPNVGPADPCKTRCG
jgi:hypothetical protein